MKILRLITRRVNYLILAAIFACGTGNSASDSSPSLESAGSKTTAGEVAQASAVAVEGELAPDFTLSRVDGGEVTLSELRGEVVILDFWATWCPPCRMEIPDFVELYEKYKDEGLLIIGVNLDGGDSRSVKQFSEEYKINYPIVLGNVKVTEDYGGIRAIPTTFVIDRNGNVREKYVGYRPRAIFEDQAKKLLEVP